MMNRYFCLIHKQGVVCVGAPHGTTTWTLNSHEDNPYHDFKMHAQLFGGSHLFMPQTNTFTGRIARRDEFRNEEGLSFEEQNPYKMPQSRLWIGVEAEGCVLQRNEVFATGTADCFTVVISHKDGFVLPFHAGLRSLIDIEYVLSGIQSREHFSVIDAALDEVKKCGLNKRELTISVHCGIGWQYYRYPHDHEVYGERNKVITTYLHEEVHKHAAPHVHPQTKEDIAHLGHINLREIIYRQFQKRGVLLKQIVYDGIDTGPPELAIPGSQFPVHNPYASHTRGNDVVHKKHNTIVRRNLVMVWHLRKPFYEPKKKK